MKALISNNGYLVKIHGDDLTVKDEIPVGTYIVCQNGMTKQFFLEKKDDLHISEKTYGTLDKNVDLVFSRWESVDFQKRNLGVLLSGVKGSGKSITSIKLSEKAIESEMAVIIVNRNFQEGLPDFLNSISQKCMILFDEFEKNYDRYEQNYMLSMFDGMSSGSRMFVITCNNACELSNFIINRPGRFHFHFQYGYMSEEEVIEFFNDKVRLDSAKQYLDSIVIFSKVSKLNYDTLRSIITELNLGASFDDCLSYLNISANTDSFNTYSGKIIDSNGAVYRSHRERINFLSEDGDSVIFNKECDFGECCMDDFYLNFDLSNIKFDNDKISIVGGTFFNQNKQRDGFIRYVSAEFEKESIDTGRYKFNF